MTCIRQAKAEAKGAKELKAYIVKLAKDIKYVQRVKEWSLSM